MRPSRTSSSAAVRPAGPAPMMRDLDQRMSARLQHPQGIPKFRARHLDHPAPPRLGLHSIHERRYTGAAHQHALVLPDQFTRRTYGAQLALVNQAEAVGKTLHVVQHMRSQKDRATLLPVLGKNIHDLAPADRVEPGKRLVEDQQARLDRHRMGQCRALRHALGKAAYHLVCNLCQAETVQPPHARAHT
jgi:hypothetical protein